MWDVEGLWLKAKLYADRAALVKTASGEFPLLSSLSLEFLARAALSKVHPVLNAEPKDHENILYAFGVHLKQPKSIPSHSVYSRLLYFVKGFGKPQRAICDYLSLLRNAELHSSELAFEKVRLAEWLPRYYEVVNILCIFLGKTLTEFLGKKTTSHALALIKALGTKQRSKVTAKLTSHAKDFRSKTEAERESLRRQAKLKATMPVLHSAMYECPACKSAGRLHGTWMRDSNPFYSEDELLVEETYLAERFECGACGLNLSNTEEILLAGIEPTFTMLTSTDLHEEAEGDWGEDYANM